MTCDFLSEIQGVWASGACGGDWWPASGKEAGRRHGGNVSQESPGNEGTCFYRSKCIYHTEPKLSIELSQE